MPNRILNILLCRSNDVVDTRVERARPVEQNVGVQRNVARQPRQLPGVARPRQNEVPRPAIQRPAAPIAPVVLAIAAPPRQQPVRQVNTARPEVATLVPPAAGAQLPDGSLEMTLPAPFSDMSSRQKIDALVIAASGLERKNHGRTLASLYAAASRGQQVDFREPVVKIETRKLSSQACRKFALEIALKSEGHRHEISTLSAALLEHALPEQTEFVILGVNISRDRLARWAMSQQLPGNIIVTDETRNADKLLMAENSQTVHELAIEKVGEAKFNRMRGKIPPGRQISTDDTEVGIRKYLATTASPETALRGLTRVMRKTNANNSFDEAADEVARGMPASLRSTMSVIWSYIQHVDTPALKERLCESMTNKLREIAMEGPCNVGACQRLLDIPTAIDWSVTEDISIEDLRRELAEIAAEVNEKYESEDDYYAQHRVEDGWEEAKGQDVDPNVNPELVPENLQDELKTELKKSLFSEKAEIELVVLRNIDATLVQDEIKRLLPGF